VIFAGVPFHLIALRKNRSAALRSRLAVNKKSIVAQAPVVMLVAVYRSHLLRVATGSDPGVDDWLHIGFPGLPRPYLGRTAAVAGLTFRREMNGRCWMTSTRWSTGRWRNGSFLV
jgi:hypothetical protein